MTAIAGYLRMLRDVEGVHGSFVVGGAGVLVAEDLPAIFDGDLLGEAGTRVARLYETFSSGGGDLETCMLRYAEHKIYVRRMTWGILAILLGVRINLPALRMVTNLVVRRIDPELGTRTSEPSRMPASHAVGRHERPSSWPPTVTGAVPAAMPTSDSVPASGMDVPATGMAAVALRALELRVPSAAVLPEDGRDAEPAVTERHVRRYRGRPIEDDG